MEEERRLLYVGMTRARKRVSLSCAGNRMLFGNRKNQEASRFLREIQGAFAQHYPPVSSYGSSYQRHVPEDLHCGTIPRDYASRGRFGTASQDLYGGLDDPVDAPIERREKRVSDQAPAALFSAGDAVVHPRFGAGQVLASYGEGENVKVSIRFRSEEHPRLLALKYANLRRVKQ